MYERYDHSPSYPGDKYDPQADEIAYQEYLRSLGPTYVDRETQYALDRERGINLVPRHLKAEASDSLTYRRGMLLRVPGMIDNNGEKL